MKEMNYQDVMKEKFKRQEAIKELELHAGGHVAHIGKISPGCRKCMTGNLEQGGGIQIGNLCQFKCPMCYYDPKRTEETKTSIYNKLSDFFSMSFEDNYKPIAISYQSTGETLLYLDDLRKFGAVLKKINTQRGIKIYHHFYTNGVLATKQNLQIMKDELEVHEIRFHVTASNCSKKVIDNMYEAAKMGISVSVEEPSFPLNKKKLFNFLPILEDVGGCHMNLVETQLTQHNYPEINRIYPQGRYFKDYFYHLYDEGMVYDIMEKVLAEGYHFSVLDCNSGIERCRHGKYQNVGFNMESIVGMCREFDYFSDWNVEEFYKENLERWKKIKEEGKITRQK